LMPFSCFLHFIGQISDRLNHFVHVGHFLFRVLKRALPRAGMSGGRLQIYFW
jgi:hypothetical protein